MNKFSLLNEPWIPTVGDNDHSLFEVFSNMKLSDIGGSPIEKIAIFKTLLAIAQAAWTPKNTKEWEQSNIKEFSEKVINYLKDNKNKFYLYGDRPFLQYKELQNQKKQISCYTLKPDISTGNNILIFDSQKELPIDDKDKLLILLRHMNFPLGGKKVDNSISFSKSYKKKKGGRTGSSLGFLGYLHTFFLGDSILETIFINILTLEDINSVGNFSEGLGIPPWDELPKNEIGPVAKKYSHSYFGNLIALNRFILLDEKSNFLKVTEGIIPLESYKEGVSDLTCTLIPDKKGHRICWCDNNKKPWRQFTSLLSFLNATRTNSKDTTLQLEFVFKRIKNLEKKHFKIWSGGISTSNNAGEQYLTGSNDILSSEQLIDTRWLNFKWYAHLQNEMDVLNEISKILYSSVRNYYKELNAVDLSKNISDKAVSKFWAYCEILFPTILEVSSNYNDESVAKIRAKIVNIATKSFTDQCPLDSSRQLIAHVKNRPNLYKFTNRIGDINGK